MGLKTPKPESTEETVAEPVTAPVAASTEIDPMVVMARVAAAIEALVARQAAAPNDHVQTLITTLTGTMDRLADNQLKGAEILAQETRRAHRPSNEVPPLCSVFNRRGVLLPDNATGPRKPPLRCMMFIPWIIEWESINREEAELLNLLEAGEYTLRRIDNTKVRVVCRVDYQADNVTPNRIIINHDTAFNNDNKNLLPSLVDMLRQYLRQHRDVVARAARAVMTDEEEEALIAAGELSVSA